MAAEYEVNIKLNTGKAQDKLKNLETTIARIGKAEKQSANTTDRRTAAMVKLRNVGDAIRKLEEKGLDVSKARLQVTKASQAVDKGLFKTASERLKIANGEVKAQKKITKELKEQQSIQVSQRDIARGSGKGRMTNRLEQVALGAGFPLLFGGGPGSVIGGGLGGLTGSFGAQIAFSAAGQQIDQLIGSTVSSAEALTSVGTALDFLRERSLFSSSETEELARKLEKQGDLAGIAALVTDELNDALGPEGIQKMQDLAEQTEIAKEQFGLLSTNLELLIAGPLTEFLKIINQVLGIRVAQSQFAKSFEELKLQDPERLKGLLPSLEGARDPVKGIASSLFFGPNMAGGLFDMQGLTENQLIDFTQQLNSILDSLGGSKGSVPITEEDRDRFKPKPSKKLTSAETGESIARRLREQIAAYEELDPLARQMAVIEAERESIQERINKVKSEEKKIELELMADKLKSLKIKKEEQRIDDEIVNLQLKKEDSINAENEKLSNAIDSYSDQLRLLQAKIDGTEDQVALEMKLEKAGTEIERNYIRQIDAQAKLNERIQQQKDLFDQIGNSIASGISTALQSVINKTESLGDAVKGVLADIGNMLLRLGIETAVKTAFSAITSGGNTFTPLPDSVSLTAATGAYVSGPTNALIGEGGQGEYVIPESKMRESMARYSRGARGSSVIPESGESGTVGGDGGGTAIAAPIDVRYTVERINDVEYVTAAQFQAGMQQAAAQGAQRGEQQTLRRLQMSGSTRRRIGL